jgi:hypothetical protein
MMKRIFAVFIGCIFFTICACGQLLDKLDVPGPILFNRNFYRLAKSDKPIPNYYLQQYLPEGDSLAKYNKLFSIAVFAMDMSLQDAVKIKSLELENKKKNEPHNNYVVTQSPGGNEVIIDGILHVTNGKENLSAEFFVYRMRKVPIGNNKNGILVVSYSERSYGDDVKPFLRKLRKERVDILQTMIEAELPEIRVKDF